MKLTQDDLNEFLQLRDKVFDFVIKLRLASDDAQHPKAKDYYETASSRLNETYSKLNNVLWYLGSGYNFQDLDEDSQGSS